MFLLRRDQFPSRAVPWTHPRRRKDYYASIKDDPELHVKLTGSWEVTVGEQDTFCKPGQPCPPEPSDLVTWARSPHSGV